jgi:heptosyltransferase-2
MTLPALRKLRLAHPGARISVLTRESLSPIFKLSGLVDEVLHYHKASGAAGRLQSFLKNLATIRAGRFEIAVLFQSAFEAALLAFLARIPRRVGYDAQGRGFLLTDAIAEVGTGRHETLDYVALVDALEGLKGMSTAATTGVQPAIAATDEQRADALDLLRRKGIDPGGRPLVILNPGATNSEAKRWPESRYAEVSDRFTETGALVVIIGAGTEESLATRIELLTHGERPVNLVGLTDIPTLCGLLSLARVVISNDTGSAHVAAALGRPTLTIFGPTNEFETAPLGPKAELVRAPGIECERCMLRQCPIDHRCMTRITTDEVFGRAAKMSEIQ